LSIFEFPIKTSHEKIGKEFVFKMKDEITLIRTQVVLDSLIKKGLVETMKSMMDNIRKSDPIDDRK
jgi:hypothetical protein